MAEGRGPNVYSIAAHRGFADALVAGLIPRYRDAELGLARLTLLLPSRRAVRTVTEAFVRLSGEGLLLPRMAVVGDLDLDETLGPLLDTLGVGAGIPPAADPVRRWLRLAEFLTRVEGDKARHGAALLRQAFEIGQAMDRLLVEGISPDQLLSDRVVDIVGELADHWRESTATFLKVQAYWSDELEKRGEIDAPQRRNLLFEHAVRQWKADPPQAPIVAAGVTSASPALARLLRSISGLPQGAVILPDLDLAMADKVWGSLGKAGVPEQPGEPPFGKFDAFTHPQYHLKLLLNRMGVARGEVQHWHRAGIAAAPPERSKAISNLFLPPSGSARWVELPAKARRLSGVRLMECANPGHEAQAIAILIRQALEEPELRVALVSPDRGLAGRVAALLRRWNIEADDTAGRPLSQTAAGRLALLLAEFIAEDAAPVPLIALLTHPLVRAGDKRAAWLDHARAFDLELRGPRKGPGLAPIRAIARQAGLAEWWEEAEAVLAPLLAFGDEAPLGAMLDALAQAGEALCGDGLWAESDGRALAAFVEELREASGGATTILDPRELHAALRDAMDRVSVRPPWGGHPRVAIYGLLEARMSRADLVICGGLAEGVWPASPAPDPLLPPPVLRALGVPGADFRIGLAAHDLAAALGAPQVYLSYAMRDEGAPVVPSRFVLRVRAMLGELAARHEEAQAVRLARLLDDAQPAEPYPRPRPMPDAAQRKVSVSATGFESLRSDPYQFYARAILKLQPIDPLDAQPTAAWQGSAVHAILEAWHDSGETPGTLHAIAERELDAMSAHPLMRSLWRPRLLKGLDWVDAEVARIREEEGRTILASERWGRLDHRGVMLRAKADRIDRNADGALSIVDYKTGKPPSPKKVQHGYRLQLGLVGLIARGGGFPGIEGEPERFEYWSLARQRTGDGFGFIEEPIPEGRRTTGIPRDEFLKVTQAYLDDALDRWILGSDPFTARLTPDLAVYNDYDQLMRLDEWLPNMRAEDWDEA